MIAARVAICTACDPHPGARLSTAAAAAAQPRRAANRATAWLTRRTAPELQPICVYSTRQPFSYYLSARSHGSKWRPWQRHGWLTWLNVALLAASDWAQHQS